MQIHFTREKETVTVAVNGAESHAAPFADLFPLPDERRAFETQYDPRAMGARLYRALFPAEALAARTLEQQPDGLLLVIQDAELQRVPWEYLHDGQTFLALKMPLTRGLPAAQRIAFASDAPTTTQTLVVASDPLLYPNGAPVVALNVARERVNVREAFEKANAAFRVAFVKPPTQDELRKHLTRSAPPVILHFLGHGTATPHGARLAFEDKMAQAQTVDAAEVILPARDKLFCVYFNSCETAMSLETAASNLAYALARGGVPYVLGMQFEVPEMAALRLSEFFYTHLAQGETVERAVWQARRALWDEPDLQTIPAREGGTLDLRAFCLGIPVLYTALAAPARIRVPQGAAELLEMHPRREFDPRMATYQLRGLSYGRDKLQVTLRITGRAAPTAEATSGT